MNTSSIGIEAISFYQKRISPKKGFRCAHSAFHGGMSCSEFGKRVLKKYGYKRFAVLMNKRFINCQLANEEIKKEKDQETWKKDNEAEDCFWKFYAPAEVGCCLFSIFGS